MTEQEAITRLQAMTAWNTAPVLEEEEINALLSMSKIADVYGLWPTDTGWTPTYNLNIGAAEGWRWKANRAEFEEEAQTVRVDDVMISQSSAGGKSRFLAKAEEYSRKINGTIAVSRNATWPPVV